MPAIAAGEIKIGGRAFVLVRYGSISSINEHYIMKWMRQTGLDRVIPLMDGETDEAYLVRLQSAITDTLEAHTLLAGYLLPLGKGEPDWTPQMAEQTAKFLRALTGADDKAQIHRLTLAMVFDFFREGLASLRDSERFLSAMTGPETKTQSQTAAH